MLVETRIVGKDGPMLVFRRFVEWTPGAVTMDPCCRLPSTWKDEATKPLTNKAIARYMREGYYGRALQITATKERENRVGIVIRCVCGTTDGVNFMRYSYLPQAGYYCKKCRETYRALADTDKGLTAKLHERVLAEYK
jgi:hypothetical protein